MAEELASYLGLSDKTSNIPATGDTNRETKVVIAGWTPPGWAFSVFPLPAPDVEVVTLDYIVAAMQGEAERCTEWDSTPLGRVMHVAHMFVSQQGTDGLWPAALNLRTGEGASAARSSKPMILFNLLNDVLLSSEFDRPLERAEAGVSALQRE